MSTNNERTSASAVTALRSVRVQRFRNLSDTTVEFDSGLNLIHGPNGAGKTSLLEAVYLLGTTKSFRTSNVREMIHENAEDSIVSGRVEMQDQERLAIKVRRGGGLKELARGQRIVTAKDYLGVLKPAVFTAESREFINGSPETRRNFTDRGIAACEAGYVSDLASFRRALRQKARLLESRAPRDEIDAWNAEVAVRGAKIGQERFNWLERLKKNSPRWRHAFSRVERRSTSSIVPHRRSSSAKPTGRSGPMLFEKRWTGIATPRLRHVALSSVHNGTISRFSWMVGGQRASDPQGRSEESPSFSSSLPWSWRRKSAALPQFS